MSRVVTGASRMVWPSLLLFGLLSPLPGQVEEAATVRSFRAAFQAPSRTAAQLARKRQALAGLRQLDSGPAAKALMEAFARLEREATPLRNRRRKTLLRGGGSGALASTRDRVQPIHNLQRQLLQVQAGMFSKAALRAMFDALLQVRSAMAMGMKIAIANRAGDLPSADIARLVDYSGQAKNHEAVILLLQAVAPLGKRARAAAAWATRHLEHEDTDVRRHAARAIASLAYGPAIPVLIERLAVEKTRLREDLLDALVILTDKNPGDTTAAWRGWLAAEGGPFVRGEVPLGEGKKSLRQNKQGGATTAGDYFGIRQDGEAILYVFDVSLSMRQPMVGGGTRAGGGPARRPGQGPAPGSGPSRWDRCKAELHKALDALAPHKTFNLLGFANRLPCFADKMLPATKQNIARAHAWIDKLKLEFETNIYDALELSFYLAGRGVADRYYRSQVDTIFFLSDGAPTRPGQATGRRITMDNPAQVLDMVRRGNALQRIVIHTIGLGLRQPRGGRGGGRNRVAFMRDLAEQNGGTFVQPRR